MFIWYSWIYLEISYSKVNYVNRNLNYDFKSYVLHGDLYNKWWFYLIWHEEIFFHIPPVFHRPKTEMPPKNSWFKKAVYMISPSNRKFSPNLVVILLLWRILSASKHLSFLYKEGKVSSYGTRVVFRQLPIEGTLDGNDLAALGLDFSFLFEGLYFASKQSKCVIREV